MPLSRSAFALVPLLGILVLPQFVAAHGGDQTVLHVCIGRRGLPRFVPPATACRVGETAAHWSMAGGMPTGTDPGFGFSAVYDRDGTKVGDVISVLAASNGVFPILAIRVGQQVLSVGVTTRGVNSVCKATAGSEPNPLACHRFIGTHAEPGGIIGSSRLWYASADCSGPPLLDTGMLSASYGSPPMLATFIPLGPGSVSQITEVTGGVTRLITPGMIVPGTVAYVPDLSVEPQAMVAPAFKSAFPDRCLASSDTSTRRLSPVIAVDLALFFNPPFTLR